jgi:hypothetical protein
VAGLLLGRPRYVAHMKKGAPGWNTVKSLQAILGVPADPNGADHASHLVPCKIARHPALQICKPEGGLLHKSFKISSGFRQSAKPAQAALSAIAATPAVISGAGWPQPVSPIGETGSGSLQ